MFRYVSPRVLFIKKYPIFIYSVYTFFCQFFNNLLMSFFFILSIYFIFVFYSILFLNYFSPFLIIFSSLFYCSPIFNTKFFFSLPMTIYASLISFFFSLSGNSNLHILHTKIFIIIIYSLTFKYRA